MKWLIQSRFWMYFLVFVLFLTVTVNAGAVIEFFTTVSDIEDINSTSMDIDGGLFSSRHGNTIISSTQPQNVKVGDRYVPFNDYVTTGWEGGKFKISFSNVSFALETNYDVAGIEVREDTLKTFVPTAESRKIERKGRGSVQWGMNITDSNNKSLSKADIGLFEKVSFKIVDLHNVSIDDFVMGDDYFDVRGIRVRFDDIARNANLTLKRGVIEVTGFNNLDFDPSVEQNITLNTDDARDTSGDGGFPGYSDSDTVCSAGTSFRANDRFSHCGMRFQNIQIPAGSTVTAANVSGRTTVGNTPEIMNLTVCAETGVDSPVTFTSTNSPVDRYVNYSSNCVVWEDESFTFEGPYETPDLSSVIQTVIDDATWDEGDPIAIYIFTNSTQLNANDELTQLAAAESTLANSEGVLFVEFTAGASGPEPQANITFVYPADEQTFTQSLPYNDTLNVTTNYTGVETLTYYWYLNGTFNHTTLTNTTFNHSDGDFNWTASAYNNSHWSDNASVVFSVREEVVPDPIGLANVTIVNPTEGQVFSGDHPVLNVSLNATINATQSIGDYTVYWYVNGTFNTTATTNTSRIFNVGTHAVNASAYNGSVWSANDTVVFTVDDTTAPFMFGNTTLLFPISGTNFLINTTDAFNHSVNYTVNTTGATLYYIYLNNSFNHTAATNTTLALGVGSYNLSVATFNGSVWSNNASTLYSIEFNAPDPIGLANITITHPADNQLFEFQVERLNVSLNATINATQDNTYTRYWYINNTFNHTSTGNSSVNVTPGTYTVNVSVFNGSVWSNNNTILFTFSDTTPDPIFFGNVSISRPPNGTNFLINTTSAFNHSINYTINSTGALSYQIFLNGSLNHSATGNTSLALGPGSYAVNVSAFNGSVWSANASTLYTVTYNVPPPFMFGNVTVVEPPSGTNFLINTTDAYNHSVNYTLNTTGAVSYQVFLNGTLNHTALTNTTLSLGEGTYNVTVSAFNGSVWSRNGSTVYSVEFNNPPPFTFGNVTISNPPTGTSYLINTTAAYNHSVNWTVNTTGSLSYQLFLNGSLNKTVNENTTLSLGPGSYNLSITAFNGTVWSTNASTLYDIVYNVPAPLAPSNVSVYFPVRGTNFTANTTSFTHNVLYLLNTSQDTSFTYYVYLNNQFNSTESGNDSLTLGPGEYTINVSAYNGSVWSANSTTWYNISFRAPSPIGQANVTITYPTDGLTIIGGGDSVNHSLNYTLNNTQSIADYTYYIYVNDTFNKTVLTNTSLNLSFGTYNVTVSAYNGTVWSMNDSVVYTLQQVVVPPLAPANVSVFFPVDGTYFLSNTSTFNHSVNWTLNATQDITYTYYLYLNGLFNKTTLSNTTLALGNGIYTVNVSAYNGSAWSTNSSTSYQIDFNDVPTTPIWIYPINDTVIANNDTHLLQYSSVDPEGFSLTYYLYLNGTFNTTASGNTTFTLGNGTYNLSVAAFDGFFWSGNNTVYYTVVFNQTAPPSNATVSTVVTADGGLRLLDLLFITQFFALIALFGAKLFNLFNVGRWYGRAVSWMLFIGGGLAFGVGLMVSVLGFETTLMVLLFQVETLIFTLFVLFHIGEVLLHLGAFSSGQVEAYQSNQGGGRR